LKLEVHLAKITTHVDQVVDIFYVTDRQEQKIESTEQLQQIKRNLLAAIQENE
jgi:[protein-PII] uridylyltransferase